MKFGDYEATEYDPGDGLVESRYRIFFPNGYGASIIRGQFTSGGPAGLWEVAVLRRYAAHEELVYDTPINDDTLGHLSVSQVADVLDQIAELT
ncbi:MAG: hypothetical protein GEU78_16260 [Actinobacteria bacterium]|nr:hypothetical protein [Actinomycetota bacterium]